MSAIDLTGGIQFPYTATDLTREINRLPNMYGRLNELNLFPPEGVASTLVEIKFEDGFITILAAEDRGKLGTVGREPVEGSIWLEVPTSRMRTRCWPRLCKTASAPGRGVGNWPALPMKPPRNCASSASAMPSRWNSCAWAR